MSAFTQKVKPGDMTNFRLHIALIKSYMLEPKSAARYPLDDQLRTIKDVSAVTKPGLYKLTKDSRNYTNPEDTSNQYWYQPDQDTTGLSRKSVAYLYITPLSDSYIRQYTLIGEEGHLHISTRLGEVSGDSVVWGRWRPYSDDNPGYELLDDGVAKVDTNYFSFGAHTLTLPPATECNVGEVIRLDQWKGTGHVVCGDLSTETNPVMIDVSRDLICHLNGEDYTLIAGSVYDWSDGHYTVTTKFVDDLFYWSVEVDGVECYRSRETVFECDSPTTATFMSRIGTQGVPTFEYSPTSELDNAIDCCNTYEFEVMNDHEPYNSEFNYWCLFISNLSKDTTAKWMDFYNQSIRDLKRDVSVLHTRITTEVNNLSNIITTVSGDLIKYTDDSISRHNMDEEAHPYIRAMITAAGQGQQGDFTEALKQHNLSPEAHEVRFSDVYSGMTAISQYAQYVSYANSTYTRVTSENISEYIATLSWNISSTIYQVSGDISATLYTVSGDITDYINLISGNISTTIYTVSGDITEYVNVVSGNISTTIFNVSSEISSTLYVVSGDITNYINNVSDGLVSYIREVSHDLSEYTDITSYKIMEYVTTLSHDVTSYVFHISGDFTDYINFVSQNISTTIYNVSGDITEYITLISGGFSNYINIVSGNITNNIYNISGDITSYINIVSNSVTSFINSLSTIYYDAFDYNEHNGVQLTLNSGLISAMGSPVVTPGVTGDYGVVKTVTAIPDERLEVTVPYETYNGTFTSVASAGDKFIVPTVNAVVDAISNIKAVISYVSGVQDIKVYSGLTGSWATDALYEISGLPATTTQYGMVLLDKKVESLTSNDNGSAYTVPTVNAVWSYTSGMVYMSNIDKSRHFGVQMFTSTNTNNSSNYIYAYGLPASGAYSTGHSRFGVVKTVSVVPTWSKKFDSSDVYVMPDGTTVTVENPGDKYVVPTVNAVWSRFQGVMYAANVDSTYHLGVKLDVSYSDGYINLMGIGRLPTGSFVRDEHWGTVKTVNNIPTDPYSLYESSDHYNDPMTGTKITVTSPANSYIVPTLNAVIKFGREFIRHDDVDTKVHNAVRLVMSAESSHYYLSATGIPASGIFSSGERFGTVKTISRFPTGKTVPGADGHNYTDRHPKFESSDKIIFPMDSALTVVSEPGESYVVPTVNAIWSAYRDVTRQSEFYDSRYRIGVKLFTSLNPYNNEFFVGAAGRVPDGHFDSGDYFGVVKTISKMPMDKWVDGNDGSRYLDQHPAFERLDSLRLPFAASTTSEISAGDRYVVPTVNAVWSAYRDVVRRSEVYDDQYRIGVRLQTSYNPYNNEFFMVAHGSPAFPIGITYSKGERFGMVKTMSHIPTTYDGGHTIERWRFVSLTIDDSYRHRGEEHIVENAANLYIVPTVNAVIGALASYVERVSSVAPIYVTDYEGTTKFQQPVVHLSLYRYEIKGVSLVVSAGDLAVSANQPNGGAQLGTVKTSSKILPRGQHYVTGETSNYTVPTVNAVLDALKDIEGGMADFDFDIYNGVLLTSTEDGIAGMGVPVYNNEGDDYGDYGVVKTVPVLPAEPIYDTVTFIDSNKVDVNIEFAGDHCLVPTVNAVINAMKEITSGLTIVSAISGLDVDFNGRNTYTVYGLPANELTSYGMVYTKSGVLYDRILGATSNYTVPTVNAVLDTFVPWYDVYDDKPRLGAMLYVDYYHDETSNTYTPIGLYVYNSFATGKGWTVSGGKTYDNFGVVVTTSELTSITTTLEEYLMVDPITSEYLHYSGNPGDIFVVPTVNAVAKALAELSNNMELISTQSGLTDYHVDGVHWIEGLPADGLTSYGMVYTKTDSIYFRVTGETSNIVVPTVNAALDTFVPWMGIHVAEQTDLDTVAFGADQTIQYAVDDDDRSYPIHVITYNHPASGSGMETEDSSYLKDFGVVLTWSKIERVSADIVSTYWVHDGALNGYVPVNGNPGDQYIVPTVNAVADALEGLTSEAVLRSDIDTSEYYAVRLMTSYNTLDHSFTLGAKGIPAEGQFMEGQTFGVVKTVDAFPGPRLVPGYTDKFYIHPLFDSRDMYWDPIEQDYLINELPGNSYVVPTINAVIEEYHDVIRRSEILQDKYRIGVVLCTSYDVIADTFLLRTHGTPATGVFTLGDAFGAVKTLDEFPTSRTVAGYTFFHPTFAVQDTYEDPDKYSDVLVSHPGNSYVVPTINAVISEYANVVRQPDIAAGVVLGVAMTTSRFQNNDSVAVMAYGNPASGVFSSGGGSHFGVVKTINAFPEPSTMAIGIVDKHPKFSRTDSYTNPKTGQKATTNSPGDHYVVPTVNAVWSELRDVVRRSDVDTYSYHVGVRMMTSLNEMNNSFVMFAHGSPCDGDLLHGDHFGVVKTVDFVSMTTLGNHLRNRTPVEFNFYDSFIHPRTGQEYTNSRPCDSYVVPTMNAMIDALSNYVYKVSNIAPIYVTDYNWEHGGTQDPVVALSIWGGDISSCGVVLGRKEDPLTGIIYLAASAKVPNAHTQRGTVRTSSKIIPKATHYVTGETSNYTVPTVNAVLDALTSVAAGVPDFDDGLYNGVQLTSFNNLGLVARGQPIKNNNTLAPFGDYGVVKTINAIPLDYVRDTLNYVAADGGTSTIANAGDYCVVPTINAVISKFKDIGEIIIGQAGVQKINVYSGLYVTSDDFGLYEISGLHANINGSYGMVYTDDYYLNETTIRYQEDYTSNYTVPTVNAVVGALHQFVPWHEVMDTNNIDEDAETLGAGFWVYSGRHDETEPDSLQDYKLYPINYYATTEDFGVVKTVDSIYYANSQIQWGEEVDPENVADVIEFQGVPESQYLVPTVNAVATEFEKYIPWDAVEQNAHWQWDNFTLGGNLAIRYTYDEETGESSPVGLLAYNRPASGTGLVSGEDGQRFLKDFGVVLTLDVVSYIDTNITSTLVIGDNLVFGNIALEGNPGNKYIVPTINAVARELAEVVYWEDIKARPYQDSYFGNTLGASLYILTSSDQNGNLLTRDLVNYNEPPVTVYVPELDDSTLTADHFGVVVPINEVTWVSTYFNTSINVAPEWYEDRIPVYLRGSLGDRYIVPTVNAVWSAIPKIEAFDDYGLHIVHSVDSFTSIYMTPASSTYTATYGTTYYPGAVKTIDDIVYVNPNHTDTSGFHEYLYTVPTMNAVSTMRSDLQTQIDRITGGVGGHIPDAPLSEGGGHLWLATSANGFYGAALFTSQMVFTGANNQMTSATVLMAEAQPAYYDVENETSQRGTVLTLPYKQYVDVNEQDQYGYDIYKYTVPTMNALVAVSQEIHDWAMALPVPPLSYNADSTRLSIALGAEEAYGVKLLTRTSTYYDAQTEQYTGESTFLYAEAVPAYYTYDANNHLNGSSVGTVITWPELSRVTGTDVNGSVLARYTVPTLDLLCDVSRDLAGAILDIPHGHYHQPPMYESDGDIVLSLGHKPYYGVDLLVSMENNQYGDGSNVLVAEARPAYYDTVHETSQRGTVLTLPTLQHVDPNEKDISGYYVDAYTVPTMGALAKVSEAITNWAAALPEPPLSYNADMTKLSIAIRPERVYGVVMSTFTSTYAGEGGTTYQSTFLEAVAQQAYWSSTTTVKTSQIGTVFTWPTIVSINTTRKDENNNYIYRYTVPTMNAVWAASSNLNKRLAAVEGRTVYNFNTERVYGVGLVNNLGEISATAMPAQYDTTTTPVTSSAGTVYTLPTLQYTAENLEENSYKLHQFIVPTMNQLCDVSQNLSAYVDYVSSLLDGVGGKVDPAHWTVNGTNTTYIAGTVEAHDGLEWINTATKDTSNFYKYMYTVPTMNAISRQFYEHETQFSHAILTTYYYGVTLETSQNATTQEYALRAVASLGTARTNASTGCGVVFVNAAITSMTYAQYTNSQGRHTVPTVNAVCDYIDTYMATKAW